MLSRMLSAALLGIEAILVRVEVHASQGLPSINTVGLPDSAVKESRERVRSAILTSGFQYPQRRVTINLAPADIRKVGSSLDLPMAIGIVALEEGKVAEPIQETTLILGELSLDGTVRPVPGVLSAAMEARDQGLKRILVPTGNAPEAGLVRGIEVVPVASLIEAISALNAAFNPMPVPGLPEEASLLELLSRGGASKADMADVRGQAAARRAVEIAASGGHNILLIGPPGAGKTMLARRLPGILPPLTMEEAIEVTRVHGAIGRGSPHGLIAQRPFRSPHHTASDVALVGGGSGPFGIRPGEVSLAHHGVLFLDELPEFHRHVLEVLRQPLEDGFVTVARAARTVKFPAGFMLVAAMNPCACGFLGSRSRECTCTPPQIAQYRNRISGPLLDRIDLHVEVPAVSYGEISSERAGERSAVIRMRVISARDIQRARSSEFPCNARLPAPLLRGFSGLDAVGSRLMEQAVTKLGLSARAHDRVLRVARTIADLAGEERIARDHLAEAIQYRGMDRSPENR